MRLIPKPFSTFSTAIRNARTLARDPAVLARLKVWTILAGGGAGLYIVDEVTGLRAGPWILGAAAVTLFGYAALRPRKDET